MLEQLAYQQLAYQQLACQQIIVHTLPAAQVFIYVHTHHAQRFSGFASDM